MYWICLRSEAREKMPQFKIKFSTETGGDQIEVKAYPWASDEEI